LARVTERKQRNFISKIAQSIKPIWLLGLFFFLWQLTLANNTAAAAENVHAARPWEVTIAERPDTALRLGTRIRLYFNDQKGVLDAASVAASLQTLGGQALTIHDAELNRYRHPIWAMFALKNTSKKTMELVISHSQTTIEVHEAFIRLPKNSTREEQWIKLKGRHETAVKAFERDRYPSYDLKIEPEETVDVLLRWATYAPIKAPIEVQDRAHHESKTQLYQMLYTVAFMLPLLIIFALYLVKRISNVAVDGLFIGFVIADTVGGAWITGSIPILFPLLDQTVLRHIGRIGYSTLSLFAALHAVKFLDLDALAPRWALALRVWGVGGVVITAIITFFDLYLSSQLTLVFGFGTALLVAGTCLYAMAQRVPLSGTYSLAWGVYLLTFVLYVLYRLELMPLEVLGFAFFWQNAGVCLVLGGAVFMSVYSRDTRLRDALMLAEQRRRQLEIVNTDRDRLFAAASHDLRQPLQAIALNLGLLTPKSTQELAIAERIRLALVGMGDILASMLDLRRASSQAQAVQLQPIPLQPLLNRLCEDYREQARMKNLSFKSVPTSAWAMADPIWLERVLRNLIINALRYTDNGRVLVGVRRNKDQTLRVCVLDTGRGLSQQQITLVNSAEVAAPNPELRDSYGLGLYIVKRLCIQMHSTLTVFSTINRGTVFEIVLGRHHSTPLNIKREPIDSVAEGVHAPELLKGLRLLIAEDDQELLAAFTAHFEAQGMQVTSVQTPTAAVDLLNQLFFDVLLTDFTFTGQTLDGLDIVALAHRNPDTLALLITGDFEKASQKVSLYFNSHRLNLIEKPVSPSTLTQTLLGLLETKNHPVK
jgi:signal transduction histidine kinase/CheY-like chemotaxis protein